MVCLHQNRMSSYKSTEEHVELHLFLSHRNQFRQETSETDHALIDSIKGNGYCTTDHEGASFSEILDLLERMKCHVKDNKECKPSYHLLQSITKIDRTYQ